MNIYLNSGRIATIQEWVKRKRKWLYPLVAIIIGVIAGYLYYYFIGCRSGSCPITSSPWRSMAIGGLMGWLLVWK